MTTASPRADTAAFFASASNTLFDGRVNESQTSGLTTLLSHWARSHAAEDPRFLAYVLATAYHETAHTMQPVCEYGLGRAHPYGRPDPVTGQTYYGRGFVQLTWKVNYHRLGLLVGADLVKYPRMALQPDLAAEIICTGMLRGEFTGATLGMYFNKSTDDAVNARRIINGTDCAEEIASFYDRFLDALADSTSPVA